MYLFDYWGDNPMSKCARKLAPRWGALITLLYLAVLGLVHLIQGTMPATDVVQWTYQSGSVELPYILPRLADAVVVFVASTLVTWLLIDFDQVESAQLFCFDSDSDLQKAEDCATVLGVVGASFAMFGGLWFAFGGAVLAAVIFIWLYLYNNYLETIASRHWEKSMTRGIVMAHWWGGLVMFFVATPFAGLLPSVVYVFFTLTVIIAIELMVAGVMGASIGIFRILKDPFRRIFLGCESDESCQETANVKT